MVDFQSRDTRRGPTLDDDEDDDTASDDESAAEDPRTEEPTDPDSEGERGGSPDEQPPDEPTATAPETDPDATPADDDAGSSPDPLGNDTAGSDPAESPPAQQQSVRPDNGQSAAATATPESSVAVAVVTVGGERRQVETAIVSAFESAGHSITVRERLHGEYDTLQQVVDRLVDRADVDVVVTAGGIGIAADEVTIEAVHPLFEKALPGFGEAFRALLFEQIGTGIVAVRSTAGVTDGTLVFCLPGDVDAAELAVEEILAPETPDLVADIAE